MAVHGPVFGKPVGSPPYSHEFLPKEGSRPFELGLGIPELTQEQLRTQRAIMRSLGK